MNVLILTTHLEPGGIPYYVVSLAEVLKRRNHNIYVASSGGAFVDLLDKSDIEHINLNIRTKSELSPKILFSLFRLISLVKEKNIQVIHAQTRVTQVLAFYLSRITRIPYISTCHGFFKPRFSRRVFGMWGARVIAISEPVVGHLINDMKVREENIEMIHNGIDCNRYKIRDLQSIDKFKEGIGLKKGPVAGIVARLSDVKGHRYLIEAFRYVLDSEPRAQLLIVGDGKMKDELVQFSRNLDIDKNVLFIPSVLDISLVLSVMDVFVMPSIQEGLGLAIMQAQAAGVPVVASNVGGIGTLVKEGHTGLLVSAADAKAIADAIILLLANKELAKTLGANAQRNIEANFSLDKMAAESEKVYREVVGG